MYFYCTNKDPIYIYIWPRAALNPAPPMIAHPPHPPNKKILNCCNTLNQTSTVTRRHRGVHGPRSRGWPWSSHSLNSVTRRIDRSTCNTQLYALVELVGSLPVTALLPLMVVVPAIRPRQQPKHAVCSLWPGRRALTSNTSLNSRLPASTGRQRWGSLIGGDGVHHDVLDGEDDDHTADLSDSKI